MVHSTLLLILLQIRTLAARAAASFVLSNESNSALLKHFSDLLPGLLQVRCHEMTLIQRSRSVFWRLSPPIEAECHGRMNVFATLTIDSIFNQAVSDSCYQADDSVLKSLVEIADTAPKYLRPNLEATLQLCLKVSQRAP